MRYCNGSIAIGITITKLSEVLNLSGQIADLAGFFMIRGPSLIWNTRFNLKHAILMKAEIVHCRATTN